MADERDEKTKVEKNMQELYREILGRSEEVLRVHLLYPWQICDVLKGVQFTLLARHMDERVVRQILSRLGFRGLRKGNGQNRNDES